MFGSATGEIDLNKFKDTLNKLNLGPALQRALSLNVMKDEAEKMKSSNTAEQGAENSNAGNTVAKTSEKINSSNPLDAAFEKLKRDGKNTVDNLIQWMKDSKIITSQELETKARAMFDGAADKTNVELDKFKEVVENMTAGTKIKLDGLANTLLTQAPRFLGAFGAATSAFKDAFEKS
ncbi:uncharacterized protein LOC126379070 [Pectinophora gossypiella]|uniref:uncharacterized protein LOC126379070 n=1 Tax=Pectinophora gossypiella TaxID=13191 RepID=UPI00214E0E2D|nr:uncharacterized protein LOC126379070 [Pectinophora gossypiella]